MKIPSEAELVEMERRVRNAIAQCNRVRHSTRRIDEDDVLDILDGLETIQEDFTALIDTIRNDSVKKASHGD